MRILIAGGAGFVGTNLTRYLVTKYPKYHVVGIDNFSIGSPEYVKDLTPRKNYNLVEGDIRDLELIGKLYEQFQPQIIINAINTNTEEAGIGTFMEGNYGLLFAARNLLHDLHNYIYISSDEVYGESESEEGFLRRGLETDSLHPRTPLAAMQAGGDLMTTTFFHQYGLPTTVIRTANLFGPYQINDKLLPRLITHAIRHEELPIFGDGTHTRDWLFIDDFVEFVDALITSKPELKNGETFNVATMLEHSVLETTELILTILNRPKELIRFEADKHPTTRRRLIDPGKAQKLTGWRSETNFKDALKKTIDWYVDKG